MGATAQVGPAHVEAACRVCREYPLQPACFLRIEGREQSACRYCWEQAVLDPARFARRLRGGPVTRRFRPL